MAPNYYASNALLSEFFEERLCFIVSKRSHFVYCLLLLESRASSSRKAKNMFFEVSLKFEIVIFNRSVALIS